MDSTKIVHSIAHSSGPVSLVGGAVVGQDLLAEALGIAPFVVAADGGAARVLEHGAMPEAVIGDFDSLPNAAAEAIDPARLHCITEQDSTDFDKALRHIAAPLILGVGFVGGGRVDHGLAAFHSLLRHPAQRCILLSAEQIICLAPPRLRLETRAGDLVSLFPMAPVQGRSEGLKWPIEGLAFAPERRIGTSNQATGPIVLDMEAPRMLLILPRTRLRALARALMALPLGWPALAG